MRTLFWFCGWGETDTTGLIRATIRRVRARGLVPSPATSCPPSKQRMTTRRSNAFTWTGAVASWHGWQGWHCLNTVLRTVD